MVDWPIGCLNSPIINRSQKPSPYSQGKKHHPEGKRTRYFFHRALHKGSGNGGTNSEKWLFYKKKKKDEKKRAQEKRIQTVLSQLRVVVRACTSKND